MSAAKSESSPMTQNHVASLPLRFARTPVTPDALPTGFCKHWDAVYLKANGRIPCGCDAGESYTMARADLEHLDFVMEVLNAPVFRDMRVATTVNHRAFIDECAPCAFFTPFDPNAKVDRRNPHYRALSSHDVKAADQLVRVQMRRGWPLGSIDWIGSLHLEPSLPCTLRCPACLQAIDPHLLRREGPPYFLSLQTLEAITRSCRRHGVPVRRIAFGGRGEPTLNPQIADLIRNCREAFPDALMEMDTNSQQEFKDEFLLLDALFCSIDGSTREAYETYRIGGDFQLGIDFVRTATERKRRLGSKCNIAWKYILFDTTESTELLDRAQRLAVELGVGQLLFVVTWSAGSNGKVFPPKKMTTVEAVEAYLRSKPIFNGASVKYV